MSKFDAARANGDMKPTATLGMGTTDGKIFIILLNLKDVIFIVISNYV